jgi:protein SCO1/2
MQFLKTPFALIFILVLIQGCAQNGKDSNDKGKSLPVIGKKRVVEKQVNGKTVKDTVQHRIPSFRFIDQDSTVVTEDTFDGSIYVADFFFTSCPTICPTMTENMHKVYKAFKDNDQIMFLSHTVDPKRDTPATLKNYANKLEVSSDKWKFVTGPMDSIYKVGKKGYLASMQEDDSAPGGFLHSGQFFLVDKQKRIRGIYRGTKDKSVEKLKQDIRTLLKQD